MKNITVGMIGVPVLVAALGLMGGCASSTPELQRIEQLAQEAKQAADQANANATKAMDTANSAMQAAEAAQQQAAEANKCCQANTEKMNRMFEKSQRK